MHISYTKSINIPVSVAFATLPHMINVYEICLNTTNYPIFNMQGFIYCLWTSILKLFWSVGIPTMISYIHDCIYTVSGFVQVSRVKIPFYIQVWHYQLHSWLYISSFRFGASEKFTNVHKGQGGLKGSLWVNISWPIVPHLYYVNLNLNSLWAESPHDFTRVSLDYTC